MKKKYLSTDYEPALGSAPPVAPDPAEERAASVDRVPDEIETIRDSIAGEPALPGHRDPDRWARWIAAKRAPCTLPGNIAVTLLAALLGGPFAVLGALLAGQQGFAVLVYAVVFAPVIEELLKQSGMTYILEKRPYRVFAAWQFVLAAMVSGLVFAVIENLVYIHVYAAEAEPQTVAALAAFRWPVCTTLHVSCAAIASLGLVRVWKKQLRDGKPANLSAAFPWFAAAMVIHGAYNLGATLFGPQF